MAWHYSMKIGDQWRKLGASPRVYQAMGRNDITPAAARSMTDREFLRLRNIGPGALAEIRTLIDAPVCACCGRVL
jgi:hypothetical protein